MRAITLELPLPPTVNHYWIERVLFPKGCSPKLYHVNVNGESVVMNCYPERAKPHVHKAVGDEGTEFRWRVRAAVAKAGALWYSEELIEVSATFCFPDRRRRDGDNRIKPLLDALQLAGVIMDDKNFWPGHWYPGPIGQARTILELREHRNVAVDQMALGV